MSSSLPVVLGLGLGDARGKSVFTFLQMQELQHQALIYKYMASGLPVPLHLILPIWKSVAGSSSYAGNRYPTFMGYGGPCFDYRNLMEPEPGRCRRTDGKKWRCSRDVVPDQKYCERHMHRGRHRSRKHVEGAAATTSAAAKPAAPTTTTAASNNSSSTHTHLTISIPTGLQLMPANTTIPTPISSSTVNNGSTGNNNASSPRFGFSPTSVLLHGGTTKNKPA